MLNPIEKKDGSRDDILDEIAVMKQVLGKIKYNEETIIWLKYDKKDKTLCMHNSKCPTKKYDDDNEHEYNEPILRGNEFDGTFHGKIDRDAYLEWERKMKLLFACH